MHRIFFDSHQSIEIPHVYMSITTQLPLDMDLVRLWSLNFVPTPLVN
jgi:hypothetical protein